MEACYLPFIESFFVHIHFPLRFRIRPNLALAALACTLWSPSAFALRPFNGTDAAVAEVNVFELELGVIRARQGLDRSFSPLFTANYGIAENTELVFDGRIDRTLGNNIGPHRTTFGDAAMSVKHVFREGSLQDKPGPSIAAECGMLLPGVHADSGVGATCAGIVSQHIGPAAVHFNASLTRTREKDTSRYVGAIVEGPDDWAVRPVLEVGTERNTDGSRAHSALVGAVWKAGKDLAIDVALRREHGSEPKSTEVRFGLTWSMHL